MINEMIVLGCSHSYGTGINTRNLIKIAKKHNVKLPDYNDWIEYVEKYVSNMLDKSDGVRARMCGNLMDEFNEKFIKPLPIRNVTIGDQNQAWPMILSDKLGVKLSNHAIPGTGSLDVLNDFLLKYSGLKTFRWRGVFKNKLVLWAFTYPYRDTFHPFVFNCMEFKDPAHFLKTIYGNFAKMIEDEGGIFKCFFIDSFGQDDDTIMPKVYKDLEKYFLIKDPTPLFLQLPLSMQVKRYDGVHLDITTQEYIANYLYKFLQEEIE
jgi:hypothetical protein